MSKDEVGGASAGSSADASSRVPAVDRAARVLQYVVRAGRPASLAEITRAVAAPKSSVLSVCNSLLAGGLLLRRDDGSYTAGPRLAELGAASHLTRPRVRRIGLSTPPTSGRFFLAEVEAVQKEAAAIGASVMNRVADRTVEQQSEHIGEFLAAGADLIVVDPLATTGLEDACQRAHTAGVPVVCINGASNGADAVVTTDNTQAGLLVGNFLVNLLSSSGTIVLVDGTPVTAVTDRVAGFHEVLRAHRGVRVLEHLQGDNTAPMARRLVTEMLQRAIRPDAFFAINDPTALGIAEACEQADLRIPIVGVDGSDAAVQQIRTGGPILASAAQDPGELGRTGVEVGVELREGMQPRQSTVLLPTRLIHAGQLADYHAWDEAR